MEEPTPGPWHIIKSGSSWYIWPAHDVATDSERIATTYTEANARLIANAPQLLDAAQDVESAIHGLHLVPGLKEATDYLYSIIAKIKGIEIKS